MGITPAVGHLKVVDRPAIATLMPTLKDTFIMLDVGATVDCNPENLLQFALMGATYCRLCWEANPKVALLSIGEEDIKGNEVTKEAFKLLKKKIELHQQYRRQGHLQRYGGCGCLRQLYRISP
jgi:glycerol-3-phosphate acyltransferase PlsX